jgi:hypothetical protein
VAQAVIDNSLGRPQQARRQLIALARGGVAGLPRDWLWLLSTTLLADVCADLDAVEVAPDLIGALSPFAGRVAVLGHGIAATGAVSGSLGRLESLRSRWSAAERHFLHAVALNERIGAAPALARTQVGYADMLSRRSEPGDEHRAVQLLDEARAIVATLGIAGLERPQGNRKGPLGS